VQPLHAERVLDIVRLHTGGDSGIALTALCAYLERLLGDVYYFLHSNDDDDDDDDDERAGTSSTTMAATSSRDNKEEGGEQEQNSSSSSSKKEKKEKKKKKKQKTERRYSSSNNNLVIRVPRMLKDLLADCKLIACIGARTAALLQVLLSIPQALNLRNLLWHGFLSQVTGAEEEEEESTHPLAPYTSLLLSVYFSLTMRVLQRGWRKVTRRSSDSEDCRINVRPLKRAFAQDPTWLAYAQELRNVELASAKKTPPPEQQQQQQLNDSFACGLMMMTKTKQQQQQSLCALFAQTSFTSTRQQPDVRRALRALFIEKRADIFMTLFVPVLEHALRRLFVATNTQLPSSMARAHNHVLFTIFDSFVHLRLDSPAGPSVLVGTDTDAVNCLWHQHCIGPEYMSLLRDIFTGRLGMRARDRVAHAECDLASAQCMSPRIAELILVVTACIAVKLHRLEEKEDEQAATSILAFAERVFARYVPLFHEQSNAFSALNAISRRVCTAFELMRDEPVGVDELLQSIMHHDVYAPLNSNALFLTQRDAMMTCAHALDSFAAQTFGDFCLPAYLLQQHDNDDDDEKKKKKPLLSKCVRFWQVVHDAAFAVPAASLDAKHALLQPLKKQQVVVDVTLVRRSWSYTAYRKTSLQAAFRCVTRIANCCDTITSAVLLQFEAGQTNNDLSKSQARSVLALEACMAPLLFVQATTVMILYELLTPRQHCSEPRTKRTAKLLKALDIAFGQMQGQMLKRNIVKMQRQLYATLLKLSAWLVAN
jgi:hypothetical protein